MEAANLIFLAFIIAIFYFMAIRPQKRRAEAHRSLIDAISVGDEIVTIGGMHGTVRGIGEDEIELEIAPGTNVRFLKQAVARRTGDDSVGDTTDVGDPAEGPQA